MENNPNPNWERQALEHLLLESLKETRKARRWKAVMRVLTLLVIVGVLLVVFDFHLPGRGMGVEKHTAMVTLDGEISSSSMANAMDINSALTAAFENEHSAGVILRINSPGGSPVQAGMMNDEIHRLRKLHPNKPFYVVVEDICASGGYYVAVAGGRASRSSKTADADEATAPVRRRAARRDGTGDGRRVARGQVVAQAQPRSAGRGANRRGARARLPAAHRAPAPVPASPRGPQAHSAT